MVGNARIYNVADNGAECFYGRLYAVALTNIGGWLIMDASNEQDAIDEAIDHAENNGWMGYFLDQDEQNEINEEGYLDDYFCGGNHGLFLSDMEAPHVKRVPRRVKRS